MNSECYSSKVVISSGSFHLWFESLALRRRLEIVLDQGILDELLIDGIELKVDFEELGRWTTKSLVRGTKSLPQPLHQLSSGLNQRVLNLRHNSIHLDPIRDLPRSKERWLGDRIRAVYETTGISNFVTHPDDVKPAQWDRIIAALPIHVRLSVENMDLRKSSYQTLPELEQLLTSYPQLALTFDLCHWLEGGRAADSPELLHFLRANSARLSSLHFSVPKSHNPIYQAHGVVASHCLYTGSGVRVPTTFFSALPSGIRWVVEGVVPPNDIKLLRNELYVLHQLSSMPPERAAVFN